MSMESHTQIFKEEASEMLVELESSLLELEERPEDKELINKVFRAMHTIKGSGAMFGFDRIAEFTHEVETVFDLVREDRMRVSGELINLTLAARDRIISMLDGDEDVDGEKQAAEIIGALRALVPDASSGKAATADQKAGDQKKKTEAEVCTYRIRFKPHRHLLANGTNPIALLSELSEMGPCTITVHSEEIPTLDAYEPESCYCSWDIILSTGRGEQEIRDVFIFVEDDCELHIEVIDEESDDENRDYKLLGEILLDRGDISDQELHRILGERKRLGEVLVEAKAVHPDQIEASLLEQEHVRNIRKQRQESSAAASASASTGIRVGSEKLDQLVDLVGELVTVQARLQQKSARMADPELTLIAEDVERLVAELRDNTMSIRMLPIGTLFSKFRRLVRDLSKELGKKIEMEVEGAETELDKTVIDKLNDPLVHLIRNSIDHGIEMPDRRAAKGKAKSGTVKLSAEHCGAEVKISISDDGAGLDPEALRRKAVEKGLLGADSSLSEHELFQIILEPGFSTAKTVSDVSGRGVGMDVVKRGVEALRGSIEILSRAGSGTTIVIKLPLTLAIIDGLLVESGQEMYVIPQEAVIECFELTREDIENAHGNNTINIRGKMLPYVCLRQRFEVPGEMPPSRRVVLCETGGKQNGLAVDRVIGSYQTVIKPLGELYKSIECISGATILGDGAVALILDPLKLMTEREEPMRNN